MFNLPTIKLIGLGLGALALVGLVAMVLGWRSERDRLRGEVAAMCEAARQAAGNPKLRCKDAAAQIQALGRTVVTLKAGIARQNAAIAALAAESARAQEAAAVARKRAAQRAEGADRASDTLEASALSDARKSAPCELSPELKRRWR